MDRIPDRRYSEVIGSALQVFPERIRKRVEHVHFLCGVDPVFAGLHTFKETADGRFYADTAHCCWAHHITRPAAERITTVVLPNVPRRSVVIHELAHALHETIGFERRHVVPVTEYAETDRWEAFAESFTAWRLYGYGDEDALMGDKATLALFETLASSP